MNIPYRCLLVLLASFAGSACSGTSGECDPATYVPSCTATGYDWCLHDAVLGPLAGAPHVEHTACESDNECMDLGGGHVGCARAPATRCTFEGFHGRCDGTTPVYCNMPSNFIGDEYEIHRDACAVGTTCSVTNHQAACASTAPTTP